MVVLTKLTHTEYLPGLLLLHYWDCSWKCFSSFAGSYGHEQKPKSYVQFFFFCQHELNLRGVVKMYNTNVCLCLWIFFHLLCILGEQLVT